MRYSYEFKRKAIELFNQGEWPETPTGVLTHTFHEQIIKWAKQEEFNGPEINKHNPDKRCWSPEKKYELVCQVLFGESIRSVSIRAGINTGQLYQWVHKYKTLGYNGLINKPKRTITKGLQNEKYLRLSHLESSKRVNMRNSFAYELKLLILKLKMKS